MPKYKAGDVLFPSRGVAVHVIHVGNKYYTYRHIYIGHATSWYSGRKLERLKFHELEAQLDGKNITKIDSIKLLHILHKKLEKAK